MLTSRSKSHDDASRGKGGLKQRVRSFGRRRKDEEKPEDARDDDAASVEDKQSLWRANKSQKKVVYRHYGDLAKDVIELETEDGVPEPTNRSDVVIKVQASTVTHNDCILRRGMSPSGGQVSLPATPGFDVVGHIVAVGDYVEDFHEGDRVAALIRTGGNARYAVVPSSSLVHVPRSLNPAEAASMVSIYMTAYQAFQKATEQFKRDDEGDEDFKNVLKGKNVLVTGGLGPVGQALIELSKKAGASKIVATAPLHRHTYLRMVLGVKPLPHLPQEWLPLVKGNMDVVFDGQCQDGFESPQRALNDNGVLMCVGMHGLLNSEEMGVFGAPMSAIWTSTKASWFMSQTKTYEVWSSFQHDPEKFKSDLQHVFEMLKKRQIKTHVAKRITLSDVCDAHLFIEKGKARGTIVCMPWQRRRSLNEKDDGDGGEREE